MDSTNGYRGPFASSRGKGLREGLPSVFGLFFVTLQNIVVFFNLMDNLIFRDTLFLL